LTGAVVISTSTINAIPMGYINSQGGVPSLTSNTGTSVPATDPYTYGRIPFYQNTLGTWWGAGNWDASAEQHLWQTGTPNESTGDPNTSLLDGGQQIIDISYAGTGVSGLTDPDYQTVSGNGMVYVVTTAGTTSIDGNSLWNVGDLAVGINNQWYRIPSGPLANSFADPGYRYNTDGTIEMFGVVSFPIGTNSISVTLPITVPNGILEFQMTDGGSTCLSYGMQLTNSTTLTLWCPAYFVDQSAGSVIARNLIASGNWRILVH